MTRYRTPFLAAAFLAGVAAFGVAPAFAQAATPPSASGGAPMDHRSMKRMLPGERVRGRIAYLKAELKITPAQETQWAPVETAMRDNAQALDRAIERARHQSRPMDALQRLTLRNDFARVRSVNEARFLQAFKPLYAALSPAQQQVANELFSPHHGWRRG
jgi:periplasmic protein CpxP/Spy